MAMSNQYTLYHLHSDLSNGVTNIDSVTKYGEYIERAKECGMKAMAFTEHGSVFEWWHKKSAIEAAGMKYIHGIEAYLTLNIDEKIRDNYHCVLLAKNYDGFLELNSLVSKSFCRTDNHFYYVPRITFNELFATSDNIIITTACVGGVLGKGDEQVQQYYLDFLERNKHRCFLEVGHHMDEKQVTYNEKLLLLIDTSSDRRLKNNISSDLDRYIPFFMRLQPSVYRFNSGRSGRFHTGFIAQEVEDALRDSGLSTQDFAGLVKCSGLNDAHSKYTDEYSLRYAEFISLNTYMIQRLYRRIDELEQKLQAIEA